MRLIRVALISLLLLVAVVAVAALWLRAQRRQYALSRDLIAALVRGDNKRALALVEAGADPNTLSRPTPVPSPADLVKNLFRRRSSAPINSPSAFTLACGSTSLDGKPHGHDDPQLTEAMLKHGANVNVPEWSGWTALLCAVYDHRWKTAGVLIKHGADVNARSDSGQTALMYAAPHSLEMVQLLLEHGADVNAKDNVGQTPLMFAGRSAEELRLMLERGADATVSANNGDRANLDALLKQARIGK